MSNQLLFIIYTLPSTDLVRPILRGFKLKSSNEAKGIAPGKSYDNILNMEMDQNLDIILVPDGENLERKLKPFIQASREVLLVVHKGSKQKEIQKKRIASLAGERLKSLVIESHHASGPIFETLQKISQTYDSNREAYKNLLIQLENLIKVDIIKELKASLFYYCYSPERCKKLTSGNVQIFSHRIDFSTLLEDAKIMGFLHKMACQKIQVKPGFLSPFCKLRAEFANLLFLKHKQ